MTVIIDRKKMNNEDKKLTRVVSTKLSMEDDNFLQQVTTDAYRAGIIKEPTKSALVRFLVTDFFADIRKDLYSKRQEQEKLPVHSQESKKLGNLA